MKGSSTEDLLLKKSIYPFRVQKYELFYVRTKKARYFYNELMCIYVGSLLGYTNDARYLPSTNLLPCYNLETTLLRYRLKLFSAFIC